MTSRNYNPDNPGTWNDEDWERAFPQEYLAEARAAIQAKWTDNDRRHRSGEAETPLTAQTVRDPADCFHHPYNA